MHRFTSITVIATALLCGGTAWAQSAAADINTVCPGARDELPDTLARAAQEHATPSAVAVQFDVQGSRVMAVRTQGGTTAQQRAVRRAVQGLACQAAVAGSGLQTVRLNLRFAGPQAQPAATQLAAQDNTAVRVAGPRTAP
jgi:hypothetical protein